MRIQSLTLENFGSFHFAGIDLRDIESATIFGGNGAGKSTAFVDAPLWALFGKCRTDTDSMIRLNADRMLVQVNFSLDGQDYRVIRTRSKATKAGKTELAFEARTPEDLWQPIGGSKIGETQEAINSVLNADFNLCTSTNFLIQGHADKFSKASPTERKTILSQILRLDQWPALKSAASARVVKLGVELEGLALQEATLQESGARLLPARDKIQELQKAIEANSEAIMRDNVSLLDHVRNMTKATTDLEETDKANAEQLRLAKEAATVTATLVLIDKDLTRAHEIIDKRIEIEEKAYKFTWTEDAIANATSVFGKMEADQIVRDAAITKLRETRDKELATARRSTEELTKLRTEKANVLAAHQQVIRLRGQDIERDQKSVACLSEVPCYAELQARCPFTIDAVKIQGELTKKQADQGELLDKDPLAIELPNFEADERHRQQQIDALAESETEEKLKIALVDREEFVVALAAYRENQKDLQESRALLKPFADLKPELDAADREVERLLRQKGETSNWFTQIQNAQGENRALLEKRPALLEWLQRADQTQTTLKNAIAAGEKELDSLKEILVINRRIETEAQADGERLGQVKKLAQETRDKWDALAVLVNAYTTIPVFLMEQAVPMLESVTNRILEQISPSGMKVRLETQRALKSSDRLAETLDILVRDVHGERPFENYSGGERFRLDLALRLGLSELLISRAGSRLETLVIDEGLGSLDAEGLDLLRECLSKLETTFPLILVISHVDAIQGTFPTSIKVSKGSDGSIFEVLD